MSWLSFRGEAEESLWKRRFGREILRRYAPQNDTFQTVSKLDFVHLGGITKGIHQTVNKSAWDFFDVGFATRCGKSRRGQPQFVTDPGDGIGEGGKVLGIPSRLTHRGGMLLAQEMSGEGHPRKE